MKEELGEGEDRVDECFFVQGRRSPESAYERVPLHLVHHLPDDLPFYGQHPYRDVFEELDEDPAHPAEDDLAEGRVCLSPHDDLEAGGALCLH